MPEQSTDESGVSRRSVVRATAWSVPVIVAAIATPLAAASQIQLAFGWTTSCEQPWNEASVALMPTNLIAIPVGTIITATGSSPVIWARQTGQATVLFTTSSALVLNAPVNPGEQIMFTRDDRTPTNECMRVVVTLPNGYAIAGGTSPEGITCQSAC